MVIMAVRPSLEVWSREVLAASARFNTAANECTAAYSNFLAVLQNRPADLPVEQWAELAEPFLNQARRG
jgi:hypothetical protein